MSLVTIDFESFYDDLYSLSKMSTEEYLRDSRFEVIGVSIKVDAGPTKFYTGTHAEIHATLASYQLEQHSVLCHNAMFDVGILTWKFGIKPGFIFDTLGMARGIVGLQTALSLKALAELFNLKSRKTDTVVHMKGRRRLDLSMSEMAAYGVYCVNDSELTFELWQKLYKYTTPSELRLIDWTVRAFSEPRLVLDTELLRRELAAYKVRSQTLLKDCGVTDPSVLRSDDEFARLLLMAGAVPPTKLNKKGETKWAFAKSDLEFMDLLEDDDEKVVALVEARIGQKSSIIESRIARFLGISLRGALPVPLHYAGAAATKRWSGTDKINLQNLPRNKLDKVNLDAAGKPTIIFSALRQAIRARPGKKLLVMDLSQIELRINAWQSGQQDVLDLLAGGGDTYSDMASVIYGFTIDKAMGKSSHATERFVGKTTVLGCGYQCGSQKFLHMLKVAARRDGFKLVDESQEFADRVVGAYRQKNHQIVQFWYKAQEAIPHLAAGTTFQLGPYKIANHRVYLPNGTTLFFPDLRQAYDEDSGRNEWSYLRVRGRAKTRAKLYGGKLVENITQAVARIVMSDAMLKILDRYWILGTVHDELLIEIDEHEDEVAAKAFVEAMMTACPDWAPGIPLACEGSAGNHYAEAK